MAVIDIATATPETLQRELEALSYCRVDLERRLRGGRLTPLKHSALVREFNQNSQQRAAICAALRGPKGEATL